MSKYTKELKKKIREASGEEKEKLKEKLKEEKRLCRVYGMHNYKTWRKIAVVSVLSLAVYWGYSLSLYHGILCYAQGKSNNLTSVKAENSELQKELEDEEKLHSEIMKLLSDKVDLLTTDTYNDSIITYEEVKDIIQWELPLVPNEDTEYMLIEQIQKVPVNVWNTFVQNNGKIIVNNDFDSLGYGEYSWACGLYTYTYDDTGVYIDNTIYLKKIGISTAAVQHEFGHFAYWYNENKNQFDDEMKEKMTSAFKSERNYFSTYANNMNSMSFEKETEFYAEAFRVFCQTGFTTPPSGNLKQTLDVWVELIW